MAGGVQPSGKIDYPRLFETGLVLFAITDLHGRLLVANPAWESTLGYPIAQLIGRQVAQLLHPDDVGAIRDVIRRSMTAHEPVVIRARLLDATGAYRYLQWQASVVGEQVYATAVDVTERETAQSELRRSQEQARDISQQLARQKESLRRAAAEQTASHALVENMLAAVNKHAIVSATDLSGAITSFNDNFLAISGFRAAEVLGQTHRLVNSGHHPSEFWARLWATISSGHTWQGEICNRAKDGRIYWVVSTIQPFRDPQGRIYQYVSIWTDITAQKEAERAAEAANQAKSRFLATMSHEIRTPLTAIIGLSHLADQSGLDPEVAATLAQIRSSGEHLLEMLNDVLDFSKIEVQELVLHHDPMDPADVAAQAVGMQRTLAQTKGLALELNVAPDVPAAVLGDDVRLRQVLLNLVSNAVKCTDAGSVVVNVSADEPDPGGTVRLSFQVVDTGSGITAADQRRIFAPFVQADNEYTRTVGGTGLGLAISSQLVTMMGGNLSVASQLGMGSQFSFAIPVQVTSPDLVTHRRTESAPVPQLSGRVLLVEDNEVNRTIASKMLERAGVQVDTAADGAQAVALFVSGDRQWDAVLMDIHMPVLDGWEATRQIRKLPGGDRIPIIALTANAMSGDREACLAAGMNDHLAKPFDPAGLAHTLARWLPGPGRRTMGNLRQEPGTAPGTTPAPLDRLAGLRSAGDDAELYCELLGMFATDAPERLAILREALAAGDQSQIRATAHFLKGSALALGAGPMAAAAALLEKRGTAGTADGPVGEAVLDAAADVLAAIPELVGDLSGQGGAATANMALAQLQECLDASEWVSPELLARVRGELAERGVPRAGASELLAAVASYDFTRAQAALASIRDQLDAGGGT